MTATALLVGLLLKGCVPVDATLPRTLVLALDGVPYRVMDDVRAGGAFAAWSETTRLVAPFPSVTNVSFTLMLGDYDVAAAAGYELQHFDRERNEVVGGSPFGYAKRSFAWRDAFDVTGTTLASKLAVYTTPRRKSRRELAKIREALLNTPRDVVLGHVGATDALQHLRGDRATRKLLIEIEAWIDETRRLHREVTGRPLRVVVLSDHGNSDAKIRGAGGFRRRLRKAGFRVRKRLEGPDDVVASTFGLVGYGALHLQAERAEAAARAVAGHPGVEIVAWLDPQGVRVLSGVHEALIRWRGDGAARELAYETGRGDPLRLERARREMTSTGDIDGDGFAPDATWFRHSQDTTYPDALHRLVDSLTGDRVLNRATVLFSLRSGYAWGWKSAQASSWLRGGRLEGTHGSLDAESTLGFLVTDDRSWNPGTAIRAEDALSAYATDWRRYLCQPASADEVAE